MCVFIYVSMGAHCTSHIAHHLVVIITFVAISFVVSHWAVRLTHLTNALGAPNGKSHFLCAPFISLSDHIFRWYSTTRETWCSFSLQLHTGIWHTMVNSFVLGLKSVLWWEIDCVCLYKHFLSFCRFLPRLSNGNIQTMFESNFILR